MLLFCIPDSLASFKALYTLVKSMHCLKIKPKCSGVTSPQGFFFGTEPLGSIQNPTAASKQQSRPAMDHIHSPI